MKLALQVDGKEAVIKLKGVNKFYILNHNQVLETATQQLESAVNTVKIDLKAIQYIDSSAFNTLIKLHRYAKELDKNLVMLNVTNSAFILFDLLKLREVLNFENTSGNTVNTVEAVVV